LIICSLGLFACATRKSDSTANLDQDDSASELAKNQKITAILEKFVADANATRERLSQDDRNRLENALVALRTNVNNQNPSSFNIFVNDVTTIQRFSEATDLVKSNLTRIQETLKGNRKSFSLEPFLVKGVFKEGAPVTLLDAVKFPSNANSYALWESVISTNPFDLVALAQDNSARLIQAEQIIPALISQVNGKEDGKRTGVIGKTAFLTMSTAETRVGTKREVRGVCSDLFRTNGSGSYNGERVFDFLTPTAANKWQPTLNKERSPVLVEEVRANMPAGDFLDAVRENCLKQSLQTGPLRKVQLSYDVVAAFQTPELGTWRILEADFRFDLVGAAKPGSGTAPARLYWLQQAIDMLP
jgi:hypothetical protein